MRFKEIISERGNQGSFDGDEAPAPSATPAQTPDWLKKVGSAIGIKQQAPAELKDAPAGFSIDPIQRQRAGFKPATQQEISAYAEKNPAVVQGLNTRDWSSSDPNATVPVVAGGIKGVEKAARAAAPTFAGQTDEFGGLPAPAAAPAKAAAPAAAANDSAAQAAAAADAGRAAIKSDETSKEIADISRLSKTNPAEVPAAAPAAPAAAPAAPAAPAAAPAAPAAAPAAPAAAAAPEHNPEAELDSTILKTRQDREAAARANPGAPVEPPGFAGVSAGAPASGLDPNGVIAAGVAGAKGREGPITAAAAPNFDKMSFGQAFKAARDQGLPTFPWKGGSYSTAQKGENKALDAGIARNAEQRKMAGQPGRDEAGRPGGGQGSAPPAAAAAPPAAPPAAPAAAPKPPASAPAAAKPAAPAKPVAKESQEINRMRFLAGLTKD